MRGNITRRGANSWRLKFDKGTDPATGKRLIAYVTVKGTKKDAQAKLNDLLSSINRGAYVEPSKVTVAEHIRERLAQWNAAGEISPKTAERYDELIENQIVPHIGKLTLQQMKPADIERWHTLLRQDGRKDGKGGISPRTIGHAHRILSKALGEAVENDLAHRNVTAGKAPKIVAKEITILTADRVVELLGGLKGHRWRTAIITALFTGLRRGEFLALRWCNVDLGTGKVIFVREALEETRAGLRFKAPKTKNGIRDVSLPDVVIDALREQRRAQIEIRMALGQGRAPDDALVFCDLEGRPLSPRRFSKDWSDAAKSLKMGDVTLHALRHTHASQLIDAGVDVVTISKRLGHASPNVTLQIYAHLFRKDDSKAADAINAALGAQR